MVILYGKCIHLKFHVSFLCCRQKKRHRHTWNIWSVWGRSLQTLLSLWELTQSGRTWLSFSPVWSRVTHLPKSHGKSLQSHSSRRKLTFLLESIKFYWVAHTETSISFIFAQWVKAEIFPCAKTQTVKKYTRRIKACPPHLETLTVRGTQM